MENLFDWICKNPLFTLIGAVTIIQIVPIKINPWSALFKWMQKALGILDIENGFIKLKRWLILDFGNSCQNGRKHTREEWIHCIEELAEYEKYCKDHNLTNGVMDEMAVYLRKTYREKMETGDFLK